ncbi:DUF6238 family protein [Streptomyces sp. NPDC001407]|uniref:DUF6238 family protein n=1 Tax=Streptomyces sp. NPDC001407 TaxID=3364573 RepID=UPI0036C4E700
MTPPTAHREPLAYLTAATAGIRHHTTASPGSSQPPATRSEMDALHAHLTTLHTLISQLTQQTKPEHPAQSGHLAAARTRLWQASEHLHDAFHQAPRAPVPGREPAQDAACRQDLDAGPPFVTICLRHLRTSALVRRQTTPADLHAPLHGHARHRAS